LMARYNDRSNKIKATKKFDNTPTGASLLACAYLTEACGSYLCTT
jgi:hypothetical protein